MNAAQHIPADRLPADDFLDQAIAALTAADAPALRRLEAAAPSVTTPRIRARYIHQLAAFAVLLDASARNLRTLCRATGKQSAVLYASAPR